MPKLYKCAFTGKILGKEEIFSFAYSDNYGVVFDPSFKIKKNTVYLSSEFNDVQIWLQESEFRKFFPLKVDIKTIYLQMHRHFYDKMLTFIALAKKSGKLQLGRKQVEEDLKFSDSSALIIQATDSSSAERFYETQNIKIIDIFDSHELSKLVGRENCRYLNVKGDFIKVILESYEYYKLLKKLDDR